MQQFGASQEGQRKVFPNLTAAEYRLLADLLVNHIEAEDCQNQRLENLADYFYGLAVAADCPTLKAN